MLQADQNFLASEGQKTARQNSISETILRTPLICNMQENGAAMIQNSC